MSSGPFTTAKYVTNEGDIRPIRVQPETITEDNPQGTGNIEGSFVFAKKRDKGYGTFARGVVLYRTVGTGDDATRKYQSIPIFTQVAWSTLKEEDEVAYAGKTWKIASKYQERIR